MSENDNLPAESGGEVQASDGSRAVMRADSVFQSLAQAAREIDAESFKALAETQIKMMEYAKQEEFNQDKAAALREMPVIAKDGAILDKSGKVRSRFSTHERLMGIVQPILNRHRLHLTHDVRYEDKIPLIAGVLSHDNGMVERSGYLPMPIEKPNGSVTMAQAAAMSITMGKRHITKAVCSIVESDDDGTGAIVRGALAPPKEGRESEIIEEAQRQALGGTQAYTAWFRGPALTNMERGWLADQPEHENCKRAAAAHDEGDGRGSTV